MKKKKYQKANLSLQVMDIDLIVRDGKPISSLKTMLKKREKKRKKKKKRSWKNGDGGKKKCWSLIAWIVVPNCTPWIVVLHCYMMAHPIICINPTMLHVEDNSVTVCLPCSREVCDLHSTLLLLLKVLP